MTPPPRILNRTPYRRDLLEMAEILRDMISDYDDEHRTARTAALRKAVSRVHASIGRLPMDEYVGCGTCGHDDEEEASH